MQQGRCTNFGNCPKADSGEILALPAGADFRCSECESDLLAVAQKVGFGARLRALPAAVKVGAASALLLGGLGFGAWSLLDRDPGERLARAEGRRHAFVEPVVETPPADTPPVNFVATELAPHLPEGYTIAGEPRLDPASNGGPEYLYRVALRPEQEVYRVPVVPLSLPTAIPRVLRDVAAHLTVHPRLPPGRAYSTTGASPVAADELQMEGTWRVRVEQSAAGWRVIEARPLELTAPAGVAASDAGFLTRGELDNVGTQQDAALAEYRTRWDAVERDIATFRSEALRGVPARCTKNTAPLLREVVRLTSDCTRIALPAERNECFVRRDRINSEIGECETQSRLHQEGMARANRAVEDYRRQRLESFQQELRRQAETARSSVQ